MGTGEEEEGVDGVVVPQSVETAPETLRLGTGKGLKQGESSVKDNPGYEEMWGAISGPLEAKRGGGTIATGVKNVHTGFAEEHILPDVVFETQYHSFQSNRKAEDPTGATIKGNKKLSTLGGKARGNEGFGALDKNDGEQGIKRLSKLKKRKERRTEDEEGSKRRREFPVEDRRMNLPVPLERNGDQQEVKPTSTYHGNAKDLGGRVEGRECLLSIIYAQSFSLLSASENNEPCNILKTMIFVQVFLH